MGSSSKCRRYSSIDVSTRGAIREWARETLTTSTIPDDEFATPWQAGRGCGLHSAGERRAIGSWRFGRMASAVMTSSLVLPGMSVGDTWCGDAESTL